MKPFYSPSRERWMVKQKTADGTWRAVTLPATITDATHALAWCAGAMPPPASDRVMSLSEAADHWLTWRKRVYGGETKSWHDCERFVRLYLRSHPIAKAKPADLTVPLAVSYCDFVKRSGVAPYTQRNIVTMMRNFVSDVRGRGWFACAENPFRDDYVRRSAPKGEPANGGLIVHMTPAQVSQLVAEPRVSVTNRALYTLAYATGLRAGELAGLTAADIVLDGDTPHLVVKRQRVWEAKGAVVKEPKKKSFRTVPLHPRAREALRTLEHSAWVFPGPTSNWAKMIRDDLGLAGLPTTMEGGRLTFHALRRSWMTALDSVGVSEGDIGVLAGHGAKTTAARHYIAKNLPKHTGIIARLPW